MIKFWARYVDNILIVWLGIDRRLDHFLRETNEMHKFIKFTVKTGNKTIYYLNLTLTVKVNGSTIKFTENQSVQIPLSQRTLSTTKSIKWKP